MKKLCVLFVVFVCLAGLVSQAAAMDGTALRRFPVMKTEEDFKKLLGLLENNDTKTAAEYLKADGLLMEKGTEVILSELGCEGRCIKFQVKGGQMDYWTVLTMDGEKVFDYKK
jgi:hypothetical protein